MYIANTLASCIAHFGFALLLFVLISFADYLAGRIAYHFGFYSFGLRCMARSGLYLKRLPVLCSKANMCCDDSCKLWSCPRYPNSKK